MTAADTILNSACRDVIWRTRVGRRINRRPPTDLLAQALHVAADEAAVLLDGEAA